MTSPDSKTSAAATWAGRILGALVILLLLADSAVNLMAPQLLARSMEETGFAPGQSSLIGAILLACVVLYAIPATRVLGAIVVTGFLGGAICTHFRMGDLASPPQIASLLIGVAAWASIYLCTPALRPLFPLARQ